MWVGVGEGIGLALPVALGLLVLGWGWAVGVLWGLAVVAGGRLMRWWLLKVLVREGGRGLAAGLVAVARQALVALLAFGGIALGLPPLAIAGGLLLPTVGRWIWTVRVVRSTG